MRRLGGPGRAFLITAALAICQACSSGKAPPPSLGVANQSTQTVVLTVNGESVPGRVSPFSVAAPDPNTLPQLPWHLELRSTSGTLLLQRDIPADGTAGGQTASWSSTCGVVTVWWARGEPSIGPPASGLAQDCP